MLNSSSRMAAELSHGDAGCGDRNDLNSDQLHDVRLFVAMEA